MPANLRGYVSRGATGHEPKLDRPPTRPVDGEPPRERSPASLSAYGDRLRVAIDRASAALGGSPPSGEAWFLAVSAAMAEIRREDGEK